MSLPTKKISRSEAKKKTAQFGDGTDILVTQHTLPNKSGKFEHDFYYQRAELDMGQAKITTWDNIARRVGFVNGKRGAKYDRFERANYKKVIGSDNDDTIYGSTSVYDWSALEKSHPGFNWGNLKPKNTKYLDDIIHGGKGNDVIYGRDGNDTLYGDDPGGKQTGNDVIAGGNGTDTIYGGKGNDTIFSGALTNGESDDLWGGAGADTFFLGETTHDTTKTIQPEPFDWAGLGLDLVSGFSNEIIPGAGTVINGIRALVGHDWSKAETVVVPDENAAGYATVHDFSAAEDFLIVPMAAGGKDNVFLDPDANFNRDLALFYDTQKNGNNTFATLNLDWETDKKHYGIDDNVLTKTGLTYSKLETAYKESMKDTLKKNALIIGKDSTGQNKFLVGMDNKKDLISQLDPVAQQKLNNMKGRFLMLGAYGGYKLEDTSTNNDYLFGSQKNDMFIAGKGEDYYFGGGGSDTVSYASANGYGPDYDPTKYLFKYNYDTSVGVTVDLSRNIASDNFVSRTSDSHNRLGDKIYTLSEQTDYLFGIENVIGTDRRDEIIGDNQANTFTGGMGNDTLKGMGGNDTLIGGQGNDTLNGGTGTDTAVFSGPISNYTLSKDRNGVITVTDNRGTDGTDKLTSINNLRFGKTNFTVTSNYAINNPGNAANIGKGNSDRIAVRQGNHFFLDTDGDGYLNDETSFRFGNADDEWLVGNWNGKGGDDIIVRRGNRFFVDTNGDGLADQKPYSYGNGDATVNGFKDEYFVGNWDGIGGDEIIIRRGNQFLADKDRNGIHDNGTYRFNHGKANLGGGKDEYFVGNWDGQGGDDIIFRQGNQFSIDTNHDGSVDETYSFGNADDKYLMGDWDGNSQVDFAVVRGSSALVDLNRDGQHDLTIASVDSSAQLLAGNWSTI